MTDTEAESVNIYDPSAVASELRRLRTILAVIGGLPAKWRGSGPFWSTKDALATELEAAMDTLKLCSWCGEGRPHEPDCPVLRETMAEAMAEPEDH
jgi:hypothetical protein